MSELTVSLLTPPGRGAIATCRVEGPIECWNTEPALFRSATGSSLADRAVGRVVYGHWGLTDPEDVVAVRTADTTTEINCHGGSAAPERVLSDLASRDCRIVDGHEELRSRVSVLEAEITEALIRAPTVRTASLVLAQGPRWQREPSVLLNLSPPQAAKRLADICLWSEFGRHLTEPWRVLLVGRPNVGKSSLGNALLGFARSIVHPEAGTTRDVLTGVTAAEGWPLEITDTAGMRDTQDPLEAAGVARARAHIKQADLTVVVIDGHEPATAFDHELLADLPDSLVVMNKSDLPCVWPTDAGPKGIRTSAVTGSGIPELLQAIIGRLIPHEPPADIAIPISNRQLNLLHVAHAAAIQGNVETLHTTMAKFIGSRG